MPRLESILNNIDIYIFYSNISYLKLKYSKYKILYIKDRSKTIQLKRVCLMECVDYEAI